MNLSFDKEASVALAKYKILNESTIYSQFSNVILSGLSCYVLRDLIDKQILLFWFGTFTLISIIRIILHSTIDIDDKNITRDKIFYYLNQYRAGIFTNATLWGVSTIILYPPSNTEIIFYYIFILMGVTAGAVIIHSVDLKSLIFYPILILIPLIYSLATDNLSITYPILSGTILYLAFILVSMKKVSSDREKLLVYNYELMQSEREKAASEERYKLLLNHSPIGIVHYDKKLNVDYFNQRFIDIIGIDKKKIQSLRLYDIKDKKPLRSVRKALKGVMSEYNGFFKMDYKSKNIYISMLSSPIRNSQKEIIGGVSIIQDMTKQKNTEDEIKHLAFYDPLTHLPNRRMLIQSLQECLKDLETTKNHGAIMFLDLDRFKSLNDTLGHNYGDLLLKSVALRLKKCVKKTDIVARFGGDEFVILLSGLDSSLEKMKNDAKEIANRVLKTLNEPFDLSGHSYKSSPSIGIVVFGDKSESKENLIKQADIAMYQAKKSGRNMIKFFDPSMQSEITKRVNLETKLQNAILNQEFIFHYQPQVNQDGKIYGVEALIRWQEPEEGLIYPGNFIGVAEESELIIGIGFQALEIAFKQLIIWQENSILKDVTMSINISATQFKFKGFIDKLLELIKSYQINPKLLKIEITEGTLLECSEQTIQDMINMRKQGISFSLDDFGIGYSSLNYLKKLPIDELKIDQTFVRDIADDLSDRAIVKTIAGIAKSLEFSLIAEGVETKEQKELLSNLECKNFQGYYFAKPMSAKALEEQIALNDGIFKTA